MKPTPIKILRCAIYTRVSTDQGLDQEFNSLDAQREASQAFVKSQAYEGWKLIRDRYDDGGFSGGSMERPALQQLLADIKARRIDTVVVYKVDRLTRSLADFAKLVELFDEHGVSFVSVTQSFNTTTSMGRLTLNVLLSFAQFEREVTGERIRDKIAASKKKGMWVGGVVPLGYEVKDKKLIVDEAEAATVRMIYERYVALGSLPSLQRELRAGGIVTRVRTRASGKTIGGTPLTNGPLAYILRNRMYLGEINHRHQSFAGEHQPILDKALFDAVQAKLDQNLHARTLKNERSQALLLGKIYDDRDNRMTPSYAIKKGIRYRYYASCVLAQGRKDEAGSVSRVAASEIDTTVVNTIATRIRGDNDLTSSERIESASNLDDCVASNAMSTDKSAEPISERASVEKYVERVIVGSRSIEIRWVEEQTSYGAVESAQPNSTVTAWQPQTFRRKRELMQPTDGARPMRVEARNKLLGFIAKGRSWLDECSPILPLVSKPSPCAKACRSDRRDLYFRWRFSHLPLSRALLQERCREGSASHALSISQRIGTHSSSCSASRRGPNDPSPCHRRLRCDDLVFRTNESLPARPSDVRTTAMIRTAHPYTDSNQNRRGFLPDHFPRAQHDREPP